MSSQSSTSYLENLNESSSTKYGLEPYMYEPTISKKRTYICYDSSEIRPLLIICLFPVTGSIKKYSTGRPDFFFFTKL